MIASPARRAFRAVTLPLVTLTLVVAAATPAAAQGPDRIQGPAGGTSGTAFDLRAPVGQRIGRIEIYSGAFVDGFRLLYRDRNGSPNGPTPWVGNTTGTLSTLDLGWSDYLRRVDVWTSSGFVNQVRFVTRDGVDVTYGSRRTGDVRTNFQASGANDEVVGLFGHAGALVTGLGTVRRDVLASTRSSGPNFNCTTSNGLTIQLTAVLSPEPFVPGHTPELQLTTNYRYFREPHFMIYGLSDTSFNGQPLPLSLSVIGAGGCTLNCSLDALVPLPAPDFFGRIDHPIPLPNDPNSIGREIHFQGLVLEPAANAAGLVTSPMISARIGGY
ncbi:MAG: hypothetical protein IPM29_27180 [Planctomycetes bacterium]|nr:hypothetical protein [Planctomycetota bacterium]